jgi:ubiquinol-cytochrome c reductase iron-sulfur subunit
MSNHLGISGILAPETSRRDVLLIATAGMGVIGAGSVAWPFIESMGPDADTLAQGAPVELDLTPIVEGQVVTILWRGKPIFVRHRTAKEITAAQKTKLADLIDPQTDQARVHPGHAEWLVVTGICTHLGCVPLAHKGPFDGWFCSCHGSVYDTSGRVRRGPAPLNLPVPPYAFLTASRIIIGQATAIG